jgi:hypothetical protein
MRWLYCLVWPGEGDRAQRFAATARGLSVSWLSSEAPGIVLGTAMPAVDGQMCVLARDAAPVASADSHGTWLTWLRGPDDQSRRA